MLLQQKGLQGGVGCRDVRSCVAQTPGGKVRGPMLRQKQLFGSSLVHEGASERCKAPCLPSVVRRWRAPQRGSGVAAAAGQGGTVNQVFDTVIVGGGLSGLVAGQALAAKHGIRNFLVTEARDRVGGNITSMEGGGYVWEEGPNSFQPSDSMLQIAVSAAQVKRW